MKKILLYLNTLSNLSTEQIFFLFYIKFIKKKLNPLIVSIKSKQHCNVDFEILRERISDITKGEKLLGIGISEEKNHGDYYKKLRIEISQFTNDKDLSVFKKMWNDKTDDVEINYNYQRFYLFNDVFNELDISEESRIQLVLGWIMHNENYSLGWTGFNCAIRLMNWLKILGDINTQNLNNESWKIIQKSIYLQHKFNKSNIEHHIPGNHILFQYLSVWLISITFLEWIKEEEEKKALNNLIQEFEKEFLDSGLHFELSSHYHLQITLAGLYFLDILKNNSREIPKTLKTKIYSAVDVINKLLIGSYYPVIGDNCYNFFNEDKSTDIENISCLSNNVPIDNSKKIINFDNFYIICKNKKFKIIFDVGEIGPSQNPGHGHADVLSFVLGYNDFPIFIDPGTKRYKNTASDLELKRTNYHNTVTIDGKDQAELWGFFRWAYLPQIVRRKYEIISEDEFILESGFNGFRYNGEIKHYRKIDVKPGEFILNDKVEGDIQKNIELNFFLHPEVEAYFAEDDIILVGNSNKLLIKNLLNNNLISEIQPTTVYDQYNTPTISKKIRYRCETEPIISFTSKILIKSIK